MGVLYESSTRRVFAKRLAGLVGVGVLGNAEALWGESIRFALDHPDPRADVTADRVLGADALESTKDAQLLGAYAAARTYPAVFDGLACACACTGTNKPHRSLLTCFETTQPATCHLCQEEALFVGRLAKEGTALAEIRSAVDKKFTQTHRHPPDGTHAHFADPDPARGPVRLF